MNIIQEIEIYDRYKILQDTRFERIFVFRRKNLIQINDIKNS